MPYDYTKKSRGVAQNVQNKFRTCTVLFIENN